MADLEFVRQEKTNTEVASIWHNYGLDKRISIRIERHIDSDLRRDKDLGATVLCPGWVELGKSLSPLRQTMAQMGHTAVTLHHPQPPLYRPDKAFFTSRLERIEGILAVHKFIGETIVNAVDVSTLAHSMGGSDQTRAYVESEYNPRVMTYAASAGMNPYADFFSAARGIGKEIKDHEIPRQIPKRRNNRDNLAENHAFWGVVRYAFKNPNSAFAQGHDAATQYVGKHIVELANKEIVLIDITAEHDRVFPPELEEEYKDMLPFDERHHLTGPEATHNFTSYMPHDVARIHINAIKNSQRLLDKRSEIEQQAIDNQLLGR